MTPENQPGRDASPGPWDERYSAEEYAYGTAPNGFLAESAHRIPGGRVLCLAEGEGRNAVYLAGQGYDVTVVDWSAVGLEKATRLARDNGVTIDCVCSNLADFHIEPAHWNGIVTIFGHLPREIRARLYGEVVAGLAPGGVFVLEAYTPDQVGRGTGGPPVPELMMDLVSLEKELEGLTFEVGREILREIREGNRHTGEGAVVQVVAAKPSS
jgi:SAM-dependent methyltransferase